MSRLSLVKLDGAKPLLETNLTMTQRLRVLMNGIVDSQDIINSGSPEGVQASKSPRLYFDETNEAIYAKFVDAINGDATLGWTLINAGKLKNISISENTQLVVGNKNILCNPGVTIVTAVDAVDAEGQEYAINNQSGGVITFEADAPIETPVEVPNLATDSWFFAGGQWNLK